MPLVLSATFWVLWICRRDNTYVAQIAVAFLTTSLAFALQSFQLGLGHELSRFVANLLFLVAITLMISAMLRRRQSSAPLPLLFLIAAITMAGTGWFTWGHDDFSTRVIVVNSGLGVLCTVGVYALRQAGCHTVMDKLIMTILVMGVFTFFSRSVSEVLFVDPSLQTADILSPYWLVTSLTTIVYCLLVALTMLTAAALDAIKELQAQTQTDPLSVLLNRRGFEVRGAQLLNAHASSGLPIALVMVDLDHFKTVNDQYGHAMGDLVIADFAGRLKSVMAPNAIAGRLGGEEFAVLLPLTDTSGARLFAETVRTSGQWIGGLRITASYGVAQLLDDENLEHLLKRGDAALYQAKHGGRDCVRVAEDTSPAIAQRRPSYFRQAS
ncbi:MAG: GGDEF domain-containing protein [Devosia sp.]|nr:GGDEF domain-containing protein [Devosia sp.]